MIAGRAKGSASRSTLMRRIGGYGAVAVTPYLLIKTAWTSGIFLPNKVMGDHGWCAINTTTALVALVAILLAMAFVRPWGERLPAWLVVPPVWVGTGLLVSMVLLAPVLGPAAVARDAASGSADVWAYEQVLVIASLVGIGLGLPVALAGYAKAQWPEALGGPIDRGEGPGHTRRRRCGVRPPRPDEGVLGPGWHRRHRPGPAGRPRPLVAPVVTLSTGAWSLAGA